MVKFLLLPVMAAAAWAQAPTPPADPEAALRDRVQEFYQLQLDKKFRQAEAMVADDTKDDYYNSRKPQFKGFSLEKVELEKDATKAKVTVNLKIVMLFPGAGAQIFDMHTPTYWKIESNEWRWYIPEEIRTATPFGKMQTGEHPSTSGNIEMKGKAPGSLDNPDVGALQGQVTVDKKSIELSAASPDSVVTINNGLPGPVDLRVDPHVATIKGLTVTVEKTHLDQGEKTSVHFHFSGSQRIAEVIEIAALPLNIPLDIIVRTK